MDINTRVELNNKVKMPILGLGVFKAREATAEAVSFALRSGYRLIDTARFYGNELYVGQGIRDSNIPREELFITTKVWNEAQRQGTQRESIEASLKDLDLDYIDLLLVHWPVKDKYQETWKIFEEYYKRGKVKAIGLSNFEIHHIKDIFEIAEIKPMVNQLEIHPKNTRKELVKFCKENDIVCEAWSPLGSGTLLNNEQIIKIGQKYNKSAAQVLLRWNIQQGLITIPKSVNKERILENADIFDFCLSDEDMKNLDDMNQNEYNSVTGADPNNFSF